jgi:hypothetical protein
MADWCAPPKKDGWSLMSLDRISLPSTFWPSAWGAVSLLRNALDMLVPFVRLTTPNEVIEQIPFRQ